MFDRKRKLLYNRSCGFSGTLLIQDFMKKKKADPRQVLFFLKLL